jgi:hypothetical protein
MRALVLAALLAAAAAGADAQARSPPDPGVPAAVRPHCLSQSPWRLRLSPDQIARIDEIVRREPDSPSRRAAILRVLTRLQWVLYYDTAGVAAC